MPDINDLADRLMFIGASIPYPWSEQVGKAAELLLKMQQAGNQLAEMLEDQVSMDGAYTQGDITTALNTWGEL
jgi:hypothetical protein